MNCVILKLEKWSLQLGWLIVIAVDQLFFRKTCTKLKRFWSAQVIHKNYFGLWPFESSHTQSIYQTGKLPWNTTVKVWKMIFLYKWVIFRFHIYFPGCVKLQNLCFAFCWFQYFFSITASCEDFGQRGGWVVVWFVAQKVGPFLPMLWTVWPRRESNEAAQISGVKCFDESVDWCFRKFSGGGKWAI